MPEHFIRCHACGLPHPSEERVCPITGTLIIRGTSIPPPPSSSSKPPRVDSLWPPRLPSIPPLEAEDGEAPRPTRDAPLVGQLLQSRYRVLGVIAKGGMGIVYEGIHVGLQRPVAIKTIQPRFASDKTAVARFRNEAAVIGRFGHPNIVDVYDMGVLDDGSPYLVMERLQGETLTQRLRRARPLPIPESVDLAAQVASALVVTHAEGILHLDLKPDNLWLTRAGTKTGSVKVIDFGVARVIRRGEGRVDDDAVAGTPAFMAPEQASGARDIDGRVDVYALGMILYVMLTGRLPYKGASVAELLKELGEVEPMRTRMLRPEVPKALDAITMRAISKNRAERFVDAAAFGRALASIPRDALERSAEPREKPKAAGAEGDAEKVEYFLRESIIPPPPRS